MVVIQECNEDRPPVIVSGSPKHHGGADVEAMREQVKELRSKARELRSQTLTGPYWRPPPRPIPWGRAALVVAVHGLMAISFSLCIRAASSNRHLRVIIPLMAGGAMAFMFSLSCCSLVVLGTRMQVLVGVGITFCLEIAIGCTVTAALSAWQMGPGLKKA
eukprot:TRINITY_DN29392_c0_g1_i3.p1 TRINITY_DN29392_c0_g1~~TRINITY_DN29392_c0_g1_i3.p1  ORF type:complete len:171 (+),score=18.84 TRINITY_DN29392_c0_g1_i3:33-515(+)